MNRINQIEFLITQYMDINLEVINIISFHELCRNLARNIALSP